TPIDWSGSEQQRSCPLCCNFRTSALLQRKDDRLGNACADRRVHGQSDNPAESAERRNLWVRQRRSLLENEHLGDVILLHLNSRIRCATSLRRRGFPWIYHLCVSGPDEFRFGCRSFSCSVSSSTPPSRSRPAAARAPWTLRCT